MRRSLSIVLLMLFGFPLIAPLFAQSGEAQLPACCRRGGAHHCMMGDAAVEGAQPATFRAHCPAFGRTSLPSHTQEWSVARPSQRFSAVVVHPAALPQVEARYRVSFSRSRQKRGPPVLVG